MANFINHWVAKWMQNSNNWLIMKWWKTNFNMPVPDIFLSTPTWNEWRWPVAYYDPATSFSLSWFVPWLESNVHTAVAHWESWWWWYVYLNTTLVRPDSAVISSSSFQFYLHPVVPWEWYEIIYWFNTWVAAWEVNQNWTYQFNANVTWVTPIPSATQNISISNCPSVATTWTAWMIWVEWNYLSFINANSFIHWILWTNLWYVWWTPWSMWIDNNNDLHWIDTSWNDRRAPWKIKQFASTWSNWPTWQVYAWTGSSWMMWMDSQFWYTHIAYIWADWYKYLTWAWDYPYTF